MLFRQISWPCSETLVHVTLILSATQGIAFLTIPVSKKLPVILNWLFLTLCDRFVRSSSPGEQSVSSKINVDWGSYLASRRDFIYARVDVRGSRNYGDKVLHEPWHRLGSIEVEDYLKVLSHLKSDLPFVDAKRTAIWGSSYGGFISASVLAHEKNTFNCAISVAPVTNWLFVGKTSFQYLREQNINSTNSILLLFNQVLTPSLRFLLCSKLSHRLNSLFEVTSLYCALYWISLLNIIYFKWLPLHLIWSPPFYCTLALDTPSSLEEALLTQVSLLLFLFFSSIRLVYFGEILWTAMEFRQLHSLRKVRFNS